MVRLVDIVINTYGNDSLEKTIFFWDNAATHHSPFVNYVIKMLKIKIVFNSPYNPEFNPIELFFGNLK